MILQKIQLTKQDILKVDSLYYNIEGSYQNEKMPLVLQRSSKLNTNTYFNSFSYYKWIKYTIVNQVKLKILIMGKFKIDLYYSSLINNKVYNKLIRSEINNFQDIEEVNYSLPEQQKEGEYFFSIEALEKTYIYNAEYVTDIKPNRIKIGIVICTYCREDIVKKGINNLISNIFNNPNSRVSNNLDIYIIDNGQTLNDSYKHISINVVPNKNYGGTGGFTKGILNALRKEENNTHVLLMDDDVLFNCETIELTYTFLCYLKVKYRGYCLGGELLRLDTPYLQYEKGALWNCGSITPINHNLDLRQQNNVIYNSLDSEKIDYNGWWYCCIPTNVIEKIGLPLPFFIHRDDIEYGLRMKNKFLYLNGIAVWHEAFENKAQGILDYYELRNFAIVDSIYSRNDNVRYIKKLFIKQCLKAIFKNQYKIIDCNVKAIEDFCKGIDWLKKMDPEVLHKKLNENTYKKFDVEELKQQYDSLRGFQYKIDLESYDPQKKSRKIKTIMSTFLFNGMLLPIRRKTIVLQTNMPLYRNFAAKQTIHIDIDHKAYVAKHSYKEIMIAFKKMLKTCRLIDSDFINSSNEYNKRYNELISIEFWEDYLP